jgi:uncharacterized OB-fold protein
VTDVPFRILPRLDDENREFWTGGAQGELRFWRCQLCGFYIHPYAPMCPIDYSKNLKVEPDADGDVYIPLFEPES